MEQSSKKQIRESLVRTMERMGFPTEFGEIIADQLGTEKQMTRMIGWLIQFRPERPEEVADEMLAIKDEFERYREKKVAEYCNRRYNELLFTGLADGGEDEGDPPYSL